MSQPAAVPPVVTLVIAGGIAAYKVLTVIRRLRDAGVTVWPVLTRAGAEFVTPLAVTSLANHRVYGDLWSLTDEAEMGHITLTRRADLIVVAPATADLMAKAALGLADDLASTLLLATDLATTPVLMVPAMNQAMWAHPATQANATTLSARGVQLFGPAAGDMACGETGSGRMEEPDRITARILELLAARGAPRMLSGCRALVTAGPTQEPIDPVRFIANRSSGRQGFAIAGALAAAGAAVTLVAGPSVEATPTGVTRVDVVTAADMLAACQVEAQAGPAPLDLFVAAAAVADYRVADPAPHKLKKGAADDGQGPTLQLVRNPDILATLAAPGPRRPRLVVGFAAETQDLLAHAIAKRAAKNADWLVANDVSGGRVFGQAATSVHLIGAQGVAASWADLPKVEVARRLVAHLAGELAADPARGCRR